MTDETLVVPDAEQPDDAGVQFDYVKSGSSGRITLRVMVAGINVFTDGLDITKLDGRERVAADIARKLPGIAADVIQARMEDIAAEVAELMLGAEGDDVSDDPCSTLIGLATSGDVELFHSGGRHDAHAYATVRIGNHLETFPVRASAFAHWLRGEYYARCKQAPPAQAVVDALNTIESQALFVGVERAVHLRVAGDDHEIYIDICDDDWHVVRVTADGWTIIPNSECPFRFIRRRGMLPLPLPERGGTIEELRPFVNCPTDDLWTLYAGSLPSFFRARGPYIVIVLSGEQGSAKSTTSKRTRSLIDPNKSAVRRLPRDERDLMISAQNSLVLVFDNVSTIPPSISDALCMIATGGGQSIRQLYSDDEEKLFDVMRSVILNGIEDAASRADLIDRSLLIHLPPIPENDKKEEAQMEAEFALKRPRILGAILTALSTAIRRMPEVVLTRRPRMLDFARWCQAAEVGFGWREGTFVDAYMRNRGDAVAMAVEASPVGSLVHRLLAEHGDWEGPAHQLLRVFEKYVEDSTTRRPDWPKQPRGLTDALRRIAPAMRTLGIEIETGLRKPGGNRERVIRIRKVGPDGCGTQTRPDRDADPSPHRPEEPASTPPATGVRDGRDGGDGRVGGSTTESAQAVVADIRDGRDGHPGRAVQHLPGASATPPTSPVSSDAATESLGAADEPARPSRQSLPSPSGAGACENGDASGRCGTQRDADPQADDDEAAVWI